MIKIAFIGKMGSGKDEAGNFIRDNYIGDIHIVKFADPLYKLMEMTQKELNLPLEKDRLFLQVIGTDWGRKKDVNIWINQIQSKINRLEKQGVDGIIVTDVRFQNEFDMLKSNGFKLIEIRRDMNHKDIKKREAGGSDKHISENGFLSCMKPDFTVLNTSSLESFHMKIQSIVDLYYS